MAWFKSQPKMSISDLNAMSAKAREHAATVYQTEFGKGLRDHLKGCNVSGMKSVVIYKNTPEGAVVNAHAKFFPKSEWYSISIALMRDKVAQWASLQSSRPTPLYSSSNYNMRLDFIRGCPELEVRIHLINAAGFVVSKGAPATNLGEGIGYRAGVDSDLYQLVLTLEELEEWVKNNNPEVHLFT